MSTTSMTYPLTLTGGKISATVNANGYNPYITFDEDSRVKIGRESGGKAALVGLLPAVTGDGAPTLQQVQDLIDDGGLSPSIPLPMIVNVEAVLYSDQVSSGPVDGDIIPSALGRSYDHFPVECNFLVLTAATHTSRGLWRISNTGGGLRWQRHPQFATDTQLIPSHGLVVNVKEPSPVSYILKDKNGNSMTAGTFEAHRISNSTAVVSLAIAGNLQWGSGVGLSHDADLSKMSSYMGLHRYTITSEFIVINTVEPYAPPDISELLEKLAPNGGRVRVFIHGDGVWTFGRIQKDPQSSPTWMALARLPPADGDRVTITQTIETSTHRYLLNPSLKQFAYNEADGGWQGSTPPHDDDHPYWGLVSTLRQMLTKGAVCNNFPQTVVQVGTSKYTTRLPATDEIFAPSSLYTTNQVVSWRFVDLSSGLYTVKFERDGSSQWIVKDEPVLVPHGNVSRLLIGHSDHPLRNLVVVPVTKIISSSTTDGRTNERHVLWTSVVTPRHTSFGGIHVAGYGTASTSRTTGALTVHGGVGVTGDIHAANHYSDSDRKKKQNVRPLVGGLHRIMDLNPAWYELVDAPGIQDCGVIAQEIQSIIPECVKVDDESMHSVNYSKIIPYLISAVQEIQQGLNEERMAKRSRVEDV
jgi:hypothetical protein